MASAKRTCGRTAVAVLAVAALLASDCASAQEMPGKGMTCWDKRELCDLNCVYATTAEDEDFNLTDCSTGCMTSQAACTDSAETLAYVEASVRQACFFFSVQYFPISCRLSPVVRAGWTIATPIERLNLYMHACPPMVLWISTHAADQMLGCYYSYMRSGRLKAVSVGSLDDTLVARIPCSNPGWR
ncbi:unnamed protein product [Ectocarpus sp. 12 AP-2014]